MKGVRMNYKFINFFVLLFSAILFVHNYGDIENLFREKDIFYILVILAAVFFVHVIKAGRLYLALYGSDMRLSAYIKIYCKLTPVSIVIPYKLGEFFRMYYYGRQLKNLLKGIVIVLLDRFMDTIALVTMLLLVLLFNGGKIAPLVYAMVIFLIVVVMLYYVFPGVYKFWKKYLLSARATEHKLAMLKILAALDLIYQEIDGVTRGRGVILYFLSLTAWTVEIGSLVLLDGIAGEGVLNETISQYLSSAMGMGNSIELKRFVVISVVLLMAIYAVSKGMERTTGKRKDK